MTFESPFHEGEQRVQSRLGVREKIEPWAQRVVRGFLPEEHRAFYAQLPFLALAARDPAGRPWATLLAGEPGFVSSPHVRSLGIAALPTPGDALAEALRHGDDVGLLGIELQTRRRNRVNGRISRRRSSGFLLEVDQSFGNCPQYITERRWHRMERGARSTAPTRGTHLSRDQSELVRRSDTFFIATGFRGSGEHPAYGMDASHRGGPAGFVQMRSPQELAFPDYAGNDHFNTLGNLLEDPRAGLLFVDFERGHLLQLTGRARIDWDSPEIRRVPGARRLVHFQIEECVYLEGALPLRAENARSSARDLRVSDKQPESDDVTSFVLASPDGAPLPAFVAGQHLPVELTIPGRPAPIVRTYSLSGPPGAPHYRITVKREPRGLASRYLHDEVEIGELLSVGAPQGRFVLGTGGDRPVVLASAGVGATPLVSMLHTHLAEGGKQPIWFVHGARDGEHHPFRREVERLVASSPEAHLHVSYSQPRSGDVKRRVGSHEGRIDGPLLEKLLPGLEADFYLCGPRGFMSSLHAHLEARDVPADRIRWESFGPEA